MKFTNKHNLPKPLYAALTHDGYEKVGDISATSLVGPPRIAQLTDRHWDEIVVDAVDRVWTTFGTAMHSVMETAADNSRNILTEERLTAEVFGWTLSGTADVYEEEASFEDKTLGVLSDYKTTSVYSFLLGLKPEWVAQLNIYAYLYGINGFGVDKLQIVAILRDWQRSKMLSDRNYPDCQIIVKPIEIWEWDKIKAYIEERVKLHQEACSVSDDDLPECTPDERWARPTTYAVKKPANKRASKVFDNEAEARKMADEKGMEVEIRKGTDVRCETYCDAAPFCSQFKCTKE